MAKLTPQMKMHRERAAERNRARREKIRIKRAVRRERENVRIQRRREKRAVRMAPKHALAAWSIAVRAIGYCVVCGPTVKHKLLHAHHILPKERYPEFKLTPINGLCMCPLHHKFGKFSAHRNPLWFILWLRVHAYAQYIWAKRNMGDWQT